MESTHLLWRQLQISFGLLLFTVPTYLVNACLLAVYFQDHLPPGVSPAWAGLCVLVGLGWLTTAWVFRRPPNARSGRLATVLTTGFSLALALLFSWFASQVYPQASAVGQIALGGLLAALICLGAVTLAIQPWVAGSWATTLFLGMFFILAGDGRWQGPVLWTMLFSLAAVLALVISSFYRLFAARLRAEVHASTQSQLVGLLLHDFEEGSQDWLWETDKEGLLRRVSSRVAGQLGRPHRDLEGRNLVDVLAVDRSQLTVEDEEDLAALKRCLQDFKPFRDLEVPVLVSNQNRRWKLTAKPIVELDGTVSGWRGVGSDVTEVQRLNNLNARLALLDGLTGLANRHRLMAVLHDHLTPRNAERPCALILIDLKGFRLVNEGLGHDVGDHLLKEVALGLRSRVPGSTLLARLGGDEFALVGPGAGAEALDGIVGAVRSVTEDPFLVDGHRIEVTFQMGIASFPADAPTASELLKCAELALHEAKRSRQGLAVAYSPAFGQRASDRIRLQAELKIALIQDQFELHYQPQVRGTDGAMVGAEALVRWRHPVRGMVSPAEFIPVLEETGDIITVGHWILDAACREALGWPEEQKVAVNVSAAQFASRSFLESVRGVLAATQFPPRRLELEITESVMAQDPKQVIQILEELRALGISIALDDFGTGYSSLSYLRSLPLDKLKVDQSFVRVMGQDPNAVAIVRTVLELSKTLGLETTAEGVETEEQRTLLVSFGVDNIQGYFYSKPLPVGALKVFREGRGS